MLNAQTSFKEKANAMQQKNETVSNQLIPQLQDRGARALELHDKTSPVSVANDTAKSEETKNKGEDTIKGTGSGDGEGTKGAKGSSGAGGAGGAGGVGGAGGAEGSQGAGGGGTGVGEYFGKTRTDQDSHNSEFGSKGNSSSANKLINDALANATEFMADASRSDAIIDKSTITQQEKFVNWFNAALGPGMNDKTFDANPGLKEQVEAMRDQIAGLGLEITK